MRLKISSRRASSIRTRIKTANEDKITVFYPDLAEHLPLEQGLRLVRSNMPGYFDRYLAEHLPLEQGLRQLDMVPFTMPNETRRASSIRTRIKTLVSKKCYHLLFVLAEHLPLEQGLRPSYPQRDRRRLDSRRASSIRTRIKTQ